MRSIHVQRVGVACTATIVAASVAACRPGPSGLDASVTDAGSLDGGLFVVGPHQPYPVVPWNGGPVLAAPNLVTVTYASDPNAALREAFGDWIFSSQWFGAWSGEYGVSGGTHLAKVRLTGAVPSALDESTVGALLLDALADGGLPPAGDAGVLYAFYLPTGPALTFQCRQVCQPLGTDFAGGFHWEATRNGYPISFAVIPTCSGGGVTESQAQVEYSASHELAEGITDPFPSSRPGYEITDPTNAWNALGGEVGDLCSGEAVVEGTHRLQRVWSNASALDSGSPCVPGAASPFYAASVTPSSLAYVAGQAGDVTVQAWSTASRPDWVLAAAVSPPAPCSAGVDAGPAPFTPTLDFTGVTTVNNGQSRAIRIGVPASAASGSSAVVVVVSSASPTDFSFWPVLIQVP